MGELVSKVLPQTRGEVLVAHVRLVIVQMGLREMLEVNQ